MDSAGAGSEGQDPPEVPAAEIRTHLRNVSRAMRAETELLLGLDRKVAV